MGRFCCVDDVMVVSMKVCCGVCGDYEVIDCKEAYVEATTKGGYMSTRNRGDAYVDEDGKRMLDNVLVNMFVKGWVVLMLFSDIDEEVMMVKRVKKNWSVDAVAFGYEIGIIKYSAYVLFAESGMCGMIVVLIVGMV